MRTDKHKLLQNMIYRKILENSIGRVHPNSNDGNHYYKSGHYMKKKTDRRLENCSMNNSESLYVYSCADGLLIYPSVTSNVKKINL